MRKLNPDELKQVHGGCAPPPPSCGCGSKHGKSKHGGSKHGKSKHGKSKHGKSKHGGSKHGCH